MISFQRFHLIGALFTIAIFVCQSPLFATSLGLPRVTVETKHFEITVDQDKKQVLPDAAAWLENAYDIESRFFAFETTKKTQVVLLDEEDYSNGSAYAQNQWILIYLPPARSNMRGTTQWFANVSAHELSHILTLRKMGLDSKFSGLDIFASLAQSNKRFEGDAAWIPKSVPAWLAEGLAQYGSMHCGFDTLDNHREMLLREAWNSGNLLALKAMETYSADSRSSEMIYNQGFHLVDYLYRTYGSSAMNAMMESWDSKGYERSFRHAFGASPDEVYAQWRKQLDSLYTNDQARPEALSWFEPAYTVEDAPVYDSKTQTLYYLSSAANDFGETHLYANVRNQGPRLIKRNVNAPLHLAADGTLYFPAVRIDYRTGARISDLYRYVPYSQSVERVTQGVRAVTGTRSGNGDTYAIIRRSGKTLVALIVNGWVMQTLEAPPGTELADIVPGDKTTLYLTVARGNNLDIYSLDLNSRKLTPVLASHHNERDPFVLNGRLYFSSDQDGSYAIYSLQDNTIYRHTPSGPSAFAPFTDGKTLYYSAYTPHGFLVRSQPLDSGVISATLGEPSNSSFTLPPLPDLQLPERDRTHLELVEYYGSLGYARTLHKDYYDFSTADDTLRYNPCAQQAFVEGGSYWADPDERNTLNASVALGQCLEGSTHPYSPLALLLYQNHDFTPDIFLEGYYGGIPLDLLNGANKISGLENIYGGKAGLNFNLGSYFYDVAKFEFEGVQQNLNSSENAPYYYQAFDEFQVDGANVIGFRVVDPGADFINLGALADVKTLLAIQTGSISAVGIVTQADLELHGNILRTLFLTARGSAVGNAGNSLKEGTLAADARIPEGLTLGSVGYGGFYLESIFLHAACSGADADDVSPLSLTQAEGFLNRRFSPFGSPNGSPSSSYGESPSYIYNPSIPVSTMVELALRFKFITPSSRVAYWNFGWQAPPDDIHHGYYSISISL